MLLSLRAMLRASPVMRSSATAPLRAAPATRRAFSAAPVAVKALSKAELVEKLAESHQMKKSEVADLINGALDLITETVASGQKVTLIGFGSFESRTRAARKGRNPSTGAPLDIPESKYPAFSVGKAFKDVVKGVKKDKK